MDLFNRGVDVGLGVGPVFSKSVDDQPRDLAGPVLIGWLEIYDLHGVAM